MISIILCLSWIGVKIKRCPVLLVPALLAAVMLYLQPELVTNDEAEPVCRVHKGINVCLHPAELAAFAAINEGIDESQRNISLNALPKSISDYSEESDVHAAFGVDQKGTRNEIKDDTFARLNDWSSGVWQCVLHAQNRHINSEIVELTDEESATEALQFSLVNRLGKSQYSDTFISEDVELAERVKQAQKIISSWSPRQAGAFVSKYSEKLRNCDPNIISVFDEVQP